MQSAGSLKQGFKRLIKLAARGASRKTKIEESAPADLIKRMKSCLLISPDRSWQKKCQDEAGCELGTDKV